MVRRAISPQSHEKIGDCEQSGYSGIHFLNNWGLVYICYHYRSWYSTSENILLYQ